MPGMLYMVATPIGNLGDITLRALEALRSVDVIACEDTRVTRKLLAAYEIDKPLLALHEHTDIVRLKEAIGLIEAGKSLAYVSDAGTPGVNDPGGKLVALALERGLAVSPLPGPSALATAISVCGFPMDEFVYVGFIPHKKGRETMFREMAERGAATVFLESTHRIEKTLTALGGHLDPTRLVFIGRELTKMHETLYRGTLDEVRSKLQDTSLKGEFVVVVAPIQFKKRPP